MNVERITDVNEIFFPKLGWKFHIDPTAFSIGNFGIQWYGIIITVGLLLAILYCFPRMKRFGLDTDRTVDVVIGGVVGGIIGARAYYVIWKWDEYKDNVKSIFNTREGGLAIYGGIIGALLLGLLMCRIRKVRKLPMLDITVLGFLLGQGIGRWGNFVNQEAFGTNTDSFLGMTGGRIQETIIQQTQLGGDMNLNGNETMMWEKMVHPCFLYESLWCLLGFALLAFISRKRRYDGQIFLMYLAWYGAERFVVEGFRTDSLMAGNIRVSQALSAIIFIASVVVQIVLFFKIRRDPESYVLYVNTEESHRLVEESRRKRMGMPTEDIGIDDDDDESFSILGDEDDEDDDEENVGADTADSDDDTDNSEEMVAADSDGEDDEEDDYEDEDGDDDEEDEDDEDEGDDDENDDEIDPVDLVVGMKMLEKAGLIDNNKEDD